MPARRQHSDLGAGTQRARNGAMQNNSTPFRSPKTPILASGTLVGVLCLLIGTTAIAGGLLLVAYPDGSRAHLSLALLQHSPFRSYIIPGLLLTFVVGLANAAAGLIALRHPTRARPALLLAGAILVVWIVCEMILIQTVHALQLVYLGLGGLVITEAVLGTNPEPRA
jgi:hypothetical protein